MASPGDWLGDADRVAELGRRLAGAQVPLARLALYRRTLHPGVLARATAWAPNRPVEIFDREHGLDLSLGFAGSPLDLAIAGGGVLAFDAAILEHAASGWGDPLRGLGLKSVLVAPLRRGAALAVGTRCPGGFAEADLTLIERLADSLAKDAKRPRGSSQ